MTKNIRNALRQVHDRLASSQDSTQNHSIFHKEQWSDGRYFPGQVANDTIFHSDWYSINVMGILFPHLLFANNSCPHILINVVASHAQLLHGNGHCHFSLISSYRVIGTCDDFWFEKNYDRKNFRPLDNSWKLNASKFDGLMIENFPFLRFLARSWQLKIISSTETTDWFNSTRLEHKF